MHQIIFRMIENSSKCRKFFQKRKYFRTRDENISRILRIWQEILKMYAERRKLNGWNISIELKMFPDSRTHNEDWWKCFQNEWDYIQLRNFQGAENALNRGPHFRNLNDIFIMGGYNLSLIHIWRCRRSTLCRSRWSPYH